MRLFLLFLFFGFSSAYSRLLVRRGFVRTIRGGGHHRPFADECRPERLGELAAEQRRADGRRGANRHFVVALTQDCQLVFARSDQLAELARAIRVQSQMPHCLPGAVQLQWMSPNGRSGSRAAIRIVFKRSANQICVLNVDFPRANTLVGSSVFSYSILNSLSYAVCSYMPNSTFQMEPSLSFVDSKYSDVLYFVDPQSAGSFWTIRQFRVDPNGYLKAMQTFVVKNIAEEAAFASRTAHEHSIGMDAQRNRIYVAHKRYGEVSTTCGFDWLFRPHKAAVDRFTAIRDPQQRLIALSADGNLTLFTVTQRNPYGGSHTKLLVGDRRRNFTTECLLEVPFIAKFALISAATLRDLVDSPLPLFSSKAKGHGSPKSTVAVARESAVNGNSAEEWGKDSNDVEAERTGGSKEWERNQWKNDGNREEGGDEGHRLPSDPNDVQKSGETEADDHQRNEWNPHNHEGELKSPLEESRSISGSHRIHKVDNPIQPDRWTSHRTSKPPSQWETPANEMDDDFTSPPQSTVSAPFGQQPADAEPIFDPGGIVPIDHPNGPKSEEIEDVHIQFRLTTTTAATTVVAADEGSPDAATGRTLRPLLASVMIFVVSFLVR